MVSISRFAGKRPDDGYMTTHKPQFSAVPPIRSEDLEWDIPLTPHQLALVREMWPHLKPDWASNPFFRGVREHTRAYIDQLRAESL
jgi:hypothetical protein